MAEIGILAKKIISAFCFPLGFSLVLVFSGLFILGQRPLSKWGKSFILFGAVWLLVMSWPITAYLLTRSLEEAAGTYADPSELRSKGLRFIVVLGGSSVEDELTPADRWDCSILRVLEGVRLWKSIPGSKLVLSGGSFLRRKSSAEAMAILPAQLGVPRKSLVLETRAADTADEARLFSRLVGHHPFALVTSATHMQRSVALFRSLGLNPIPCPCWFRAKKLPLWYRRFLPDAEALRDSQYALKEYLGSLWLVIRGALMALQRGDRGLAGQRQKTSYKTRSL